MTKLKVKRLKWKRLKVRGSIWIFAIYLFITSTPTTTLTPMWLYLVIFFFLSFISNNNSNLTWFYLVFFFLSFISIKIYFVFTITWIWCGLISGHFHYLTTPLLQKKPTYKKRTAQTFGNLDDFSFFNRHLFGQ